MPAGRTVFLCILLFLTSALISISLRQSHVSQSSSWPHFLPSGQRPNSDHDADTTSHYHKVAFATFLSGTAIETAPSEQNENDPEIWKSDADRDVDIDNIDMASLEAADGYFTGARVLTYALLHNPSTRSNNSIPFVVAVTPDVSPAKRKRLALDGARVIVVDKIPLRWVHPGADRWVDVFGKLRLWELTEYKKICFIDADHLITAPLDGVFGDPATDLTRTGDMDDQIKEDEGTLPAHYMFAGKAEAYTYDHAIPPDDSDYLNSGFFVLRPSAKLFQYYLSLLKIEGRFDGGFPDQGMLNYAHRRDGNMPWKLLSWRWNANWPTVKDRDAGARSFHAKYWDGDGSHDPELKAIWQSQRREMEAFYRGKEEGLRS